MHSTTNYTPNDARHNKNELDTNIVVKDAEGIRKYYEIGMDGTSNIFFLKKVICKISCIGLD